MKFAFTRRQIIETIVWVEAPDERRAWGRVLDNDMADEASDPIAVRKPVFHRLPKRDEVPGEKSWDEVFSDKEKCAHGTFVTREYDL